MHVRRAIGLAVALEVVFAPAPLLAWQEAHQTGDDATVRVDPNGVAVVDHVLRWRVLRGPLKSLDLANIDPSAVVEPSVSVVSDDGRRLAAQAVRHDDGTVRLTFDPPRALMRGNFTLDMRWQIDLTAAGALTHDGAAWRLAMSAPVAHDGFDGARTAFDVPAAPDGPRPINADHGTVDETAVATLRRGVERDVLELVRPHVARGESATWTVRIDPHALRPAVAPPPPPTDADPPAVPDRMRQAWLVALMAAAGLAFGLLVATKARAFAAACAARGGRAAGLLPLPQVARGVLAGLALAAAIGLEALGETLAGAACVALAMLAAALRPERATPPVRGPGLWRAVRPERAFSLSKVRDPCLPAGWPPGWVAALLVVAFAVAAVFVARRFGVSGAWFAALDTAVLVPLLATGRASQLPPHGPRSTAPWLARTFRRLQALPWVRVAPWARVAPDGITADELRLIVLPRVAMPGVIGVEVGLAWSTTPVGWTATPEVLVRFLEGSAAAVRLSRALPQARAVLGRGPQERVLRLLPRIPTRTSTLALVRGLAHALMDRRAASPLLCSLAPPSSGLRSTDVLNIRSPEGSVVARQHECA
jgi:hypothetical protein